jgi:hypothetical protein
MPAKHRRAIHFFLMYKGEAKALRVCGWTPGYTKA